jgi:hypothetical protein
MKIQTILCVLMFFANVVSPINAEQPQASSPAKDKTVAESSETISVGGVHLQLGMSEELVRQGLVASFQFQTIGKPTAVASSWIVQNKNGSPSTQLPVANLAFSGGKLSSIFKYWTTGTEPDTEAAFANALYGATTDLQKTSDGPCTVTTNSSQQPGGESRSVFISCAGRRKYININYSKLPGRPEFAGITEILEYTSEEKKILEENAGTQLERKVITGSFAEEPDQSFRSEQSAADFKSSDLSSWITVPVGGRLAIDESTKIKAHNRALCDQAVTVAGLTPRGLVLYVPPLGQKFMAKNAQNYPRMCLLEDSNNVLPGVPRYLLVYSYSDDAFNGFQPVTRLSTSVAPISGTGTVGNLSGGFWNFTYSGTVQTTELDTIMAPYVIQSRTLYLSAYDENGNVVSKHSVTASSQIGGDGTVAAGYNAGQLISLLWNNPSRLIKGVLTDVQKDSEKKRTK